MSYSSKLAYREAEWYYNYRIMDHSFGESSVGRPLRHRLADMLSLVNGALDSLYCYVPQQTTVCDIINLPYIASWPLF